MNNYFFSKSKINLVLLLGLSLNFIGCERPKMQGMEKPPEGNVSISTTIVKEGNFSAIFEATGQTQAFSTVQVYARVSGYLQKRFYSEGSYIKEGQVLFTIDPTDLQNALENAQASYEVANANFLNAQTTYNRIKPLVEANAASNQDLDNAMAQLRVTTASLKGAKSTVNQAKVNLSYTTIKAQVGGFVDKSRIDVGTFVTAGQNGFLTTIYQSDPIYVTFSLNENQRLAQEKAIKSGKLILPKNGVYDIELVLGDGTTINRKGKIDFISPFVDSSTGNITYRAVIENDDHVLLPGQFVRVKIKGMTWQNVLYLPQKAILTSDRGKFIFIVDNNQTVRIAPVFPTVWLGDNVIIENGLKNGDLVAIDNLVKLRPNSQIILKAK